MKKLTTKAYVAGQIRADEIKRRAHEDEGSVSLEQVAITGGLLAAVVILVGVIRAAITSRSAGIS